MLKLNSVHKQLLGMPRGIHGKMVSIIALLSDGIRFRVWVLKHILIERAEIFIALGLVGHIAPIIMNKHQCKKPSKRCMKLTENAFEKQ